MIINLDRSVSFSGYATNKLRSSSSLPNLEEKISEALDAAIATCYEQEHDTFFCGMFEGFDLLAGEAVVRFKEKYPDVILAAVIPFAGQELGYTEKDKERYNNILEHSDLKVYVSEWYNEQSYQRHNNFLVENCSQLICYYSGLPGRTMYTVNSAMRTEKNIINIYYRIEEGE